MVNNIILQHIKCSLHRYKKHGVIHDATLFNSVPVCFFLNVVPENVMHFTKLDMKTLTCTSVYTNYSLPNLTLGENSNAEALCLILVKRKGIISDFLWKITRLELTWQ